MASVIIDDLLDLSWAHTTRNWADLPRPLIEECLTRTFSPVLVHLDADLSFAGFSHASATASNAGVHRRAWATRRSNVSGETVSYPLHPELCSHHAPPRVLDRP